MLASQSLLQFAKPLLRYGDLIFYNGGRLLSIRTTHKKYLVIFIVPQNLVGIDAIVLITHVLIFCKFGLKTPIHAPFVTVFGRFEPKWKVISMKPPEGTSCRNTLYDV